MSGCPVRVFLSTLFHSVADSSKKILEIHGRAFTTDFTSLKYYIRYLANGSGPWTAVKKLYNKALLKVEKEHNVKLAAAAAF